MTRQQHATGDAVRAQAEAWSDEQIECRMYSHGWAPHRAAWGTGRTFLYVIHRCSRCGTERHQELSPRGHVYAQWYVYAEGYLSKGLGRIVGDARDDLRMTMIDRVFMIEHGNKALPHSQATRDATHTQASVTKITSRKAS